MVCYRQKKKVFKATQKRNESTDSCALWNCVQIVGLFLCHAKDKVKILVSVLLYPIHLTTDGEDELVIYHSLSVLWLHRFYPALSCKLIYVFFLSCFISSKIWNGFVYKDRQTWFFAALFASAVGSWVGSLEDWKIPTTCCPSKWVVPVCTEHWHSAEVLDGSFQTEKTLLVKDCSSHLLSDRSTCMFFVFIWSFEMDQENMHAWYYRVYHYLQ